MAHYEFGGYVSIDAQAYTTYTPRGVHSWTAATFSGENCMVAAGTNTAASGYSTVNAQLDYTVHFATAGTYYVWLYTNTSSTSNDSCHVGLNATETASATPIAGTAVAGWVWRRTKVDTSLSTITIPAAGTYSITIWNREASFRFGHIVMSTRTDYTPTGKPLQSKTSIASVAAEILRPNNHRIAYYITARRDGEVLFDVSRTVTRASLTVGEHGSMQLQLRSAMDLTSSQRLRTLAITPHVEVYDGVSRIWIGILSDVNPYPNEVELSAVGVWSLLSEGAPPYTSFWSTTKTEDFFVCDARSMPDNRIGFHDFNIDSNIYIAAKKNVSIGTTNSTARVGFAVPHKSVNNIRSVSFSYAVGLGDSFNAGLQDFICPFPVFSSNWTIQSGMWVATTTGTGSQNINTSTAVSAVAFYLYRAAANTVITTEPETYYARITNIRLRATNTSTNVSSSLVIGDIISYVRSQYALYNTSYSAIIHQNSIIDTTTNDQLDLIYEDANPADAIKEQASIANLSVFFDMDNRLHAVSSVIGKIWYVVTDIDANPSFIDQRNVAYAIYADPDDRTLRTNTNDDTMSIETFGIARYAVVNTDTTSQSLAETLRNDELTRQRSRPTVAAVTARYVTDHTDQVWPVTYVRVGDIIVIRKQTDTLTDIVDNVISFRVVEIKIDSVSGEATITPNEITPNIEAMLARI